MDVTKAEEIAAMLSAFARDDRVAGLLGYSVGRILLNIANRGEDWQRAYTHDQVAHVADWLVVACRNEAAWLTNLDGKGRPLKLMKLGDIESVMKETDKAMRIEIQRAGRVALEEGHEYLVAELRDGYRLVQMLSPEALDRESSFMQHCIGNGAYDDALTDATVAFWSLRDRAGKPHVTFEIGVERGNQVLRQVQGKQNRAPGDTYMPFVADIVKAFRLRPGGGFEFDAHAIDEEFGLLRKDSLPDGARLVGDVSLERMTALPDDLSVEGTLRIINSPELTALPDRLAVGGLCLLDTAVTRLPDGFSVKRGLSLERTQLRRLPERLVVGEDLYLNETEMTVLPAGLEVGGTINTWKTRILDWSQVTEVRGDFIVDAYKATILPETLVVRGGFRLIGDVAALPASLHVFGSLRIAGTSITALPDGLVVGETLDLRDTEVTDLGEDMRIGNLDLAKSKVTRLPRTLHVSGDLWLNDSVREIPEGVTVEGDIVIDRAPYIVGKYGTVHVDRQKYSLDDARALLATRDVLPARAMR